VSAAPQRSSGSLVRDNAVGAVLVAVAVLVGAFLLASGYDEEGGIVDTGESSSVTTTTTVAAGAGDTTTTTAVAAARPSAQVPVLVVNGAGVAGAAGTLGNQLTAAGYTSVETGNTSPVTATTVYYAEGAQAEAQAVATLVGTDPAAVQPITGSPVPAGSAIVVVVIGPNTAA
jgi:hypothetical protein